MKHTTSNHGSKLLDLLLPLGFDTVEHPYPSPYPVLHFVQHLLLVAGFQTQSSLR